MNPDSTFQNVTCIYIYKDIGNSGGSTKLSSLRLVHLLQITIMEQEQRWHLKEAQSIKMKE